MTRRTMMSLVCLLAMLLVSGSIVSAQQVSYSGSNIKELDVLTAPLSTQGRIPLIDKFDFEYTNDSDHHIRTVAFAPPERPFFQYPFYDDPYSVIFTDNPHNRFNYDVSAQYLDIDPNRVFVEGTNQCWGTCTRTLAPVLNDPSGTFVLINFILEYENTDHHIDAIRVEERNGVLTVEFNDRNDDDQFFFAITYALLPSDMVSSTGTFGRSRALASDGRATGMSGDTVIAGFNFDYRGDIDNHVLDWAVDASNSGMVNIEYSDENENDEFAWSVDLVELD